MEKMSTFKLLEMKNSPLKEELPLSKNMLLAAS
jgi:hypothetical protein